MARTFVEGSGSGPSDHQPMHLSVNDAGSVQLPEGVNPGDLDLSRDGQNLVMTAPNGEVFVIENYFAMPDAPMILGANGALLTPNLVQSFVSSLNEIEVAAGPQVGNDASPVGEVTEVTGDATVTHTDGSKEKITVGSKIFEGDIIETDDKGAVNIQFADDSTFAVSQNARLAVDDFSFNPDDQSGSTGLSILRGVFMFTSGLVGRENPDAVHLDTPVGSIGIRGTIIGGEIDSNGKAQISVIEGAIVVRNGAGEQILSNQFETVQLTGFNAPMTNIGTLNAQSMTHSYGAVRAVAPTLFTSIDDTARDQGQPQNNNQPQHGQDAQPETQPQSQADAPQPQAEAQPQQQPAQTVLQDTPVFQTLNTGSNIDNSLGAPALHTQIGTPAPATTAAPAPSSAPAAAPAPQQSAPATSADTTTAPVRDTRPPSSLLFANDTVATNVGEDTVAGTKVAAVHQVTNLGFAVTYSLVDNAGGLFTIDANSGEVFVAAGHTTADLDGGAHGPYNIVVRTARADNPTIGTETPLTLNLVSVDEAPTFGTGGVSTTEGGTQVLSAGMIDAMDPEGQNSTLSYTFKGQQHGTLEKDSGGGFTAMTVGDTFTQADLIAGNVRFVHDGTEPALNLAKFSVTATDATGHESGVKQINVNATPVNDAPVQDTTLATPTMAERGTLSLDGSRLLWTDSDVSSSPTSIVYTLGTQNHGIVQKFVSGVWTNMSSGQTFTQADINAGNKIRFVQNDDENTTAGFAYTVTDGVIGSPIAGSFSTNVTPVNDTPELDQNNDQTVTEGQHVLITTPDLNYNDDDNLSDEVLYTVTATQNGTIEFSSDGGTTWTPGVSSFTQDDINNGRVAFKHNDSETTAASFTFTVTDGTDTAVTETHEFVVTPVNDAPTGVTLTLTTSAIDERIASGAPEIEIGTVTVSDAEGAFNPGDHDLVVQSFNGTTYVDDARFAVLPNGSGGWKVVVEANTGFNHEDFASISLKIKLVDDDGVTSHGPIYSSAVNLNIDDVNEAPNDFFVNQNKDFSAGTDLAVSGLQSNPIVAVLGNDDPDNDPTFLLNASRYQITNVTGGFSLSDFSIVDVTDDHGHTQQVLKFNKPTGYDFPDGGLNFTITVKMDATQNGFDAGDVVHTFNVTGRNDVLVLETLNGSNGFSITNDQRFPGTSGGAAFGAGLAVGDLDGDGKNDILVGAPLAMNGGGTQETGGIYAFKNGTAFKTDSQNGQVLLSNLVDPTPSLPGFFQELPDGNDGHRYGSRVTYLSNFDGKSSAGGDVAIVNATTDGAPNIGTVSILSGYRMLDGTTNNELIARVINISNGGKSGDDLIGSITVSSLGDVNGDGKADLFVGAQYDGTSESGRGMVVFGSTSLSGDLDFATGSGQLILAPGSASDHFGKEAAGLGDLNNDGYNDYVVSSGGANGKAYVYFGNANGDAGTPLIINGTASNPMTPQVGSAGDFNGDGFNDFMIRSEPTVDGTQGSVKVIYGNAGLDGYTAFNTDQLNVATGFNGVNIHWNAADSSIRVGDVFTTAGDFNGDGFDDVVIDVSKNLGAAGYEHTLFVVYGFNGTGTVNLNSLMAGTTASEANKGYKIRMLDPTGEHISVASAGDINGDGFDDLMISNPGAATSPNHPSAHDGEAYVVYGGNYNEIPMTKINDGQTINATAGNGQVFIGSSGNNTLGNDQAAQLMTFNAGAGDDTFRLASSAALNFQTYDGGAGTRDTLKLFFSASENPANSAATNLTPINLMGVSNKMSGVEVIAFDTGSYSDKVQLKLADVLSLMSTSDTHSLTILSMENTYAGSQANMLGLYQNDGTTPITNLAAFGFTKDANGDTTQDQVSLTGAGGTGTGYVYTHMETGFQLIVDSRIQNAATMSST